MEAAPTLYNIIISVLKNPALKSQSILGQAFVADLITRSSNDKKVNFEEIEGALTFKGYPDGDFIHQVINATKYCYQICSIFNHWSKKKEFPIRFIEEKKFIDQTKVIIESLNIFTPEIKALISMIDNPCNNKCLN